MQYFPYFILYIFKVSCRYAVCGKGLINIYLRILILLPGREVIGTRWGFPGSTELSRHESICTQWKTGWTSQTPALDWPRRSRKCTFNPFPHTTILLQTTLNIFCQIMENLYNWMDNRWLKVENIVTKGEIARFVQFLLLLLCFQKAVCCRGVRKRLYEGKG